MDIRALSDENKIARAERKRNKDIKFKNILPAHEEKKEVSIDIKLHTQPKINPLKDSAIAYNTVRRSKIQGVTAGDFKLEVQVSQQVEQQQQEQQQMQQQVQVTYEKYVRRLGDEESKYEEYKGYEKLISIQPYTLGEGDQWKLRDDLRESYGEMSVLYLRLLAGHHESRFNSIGYVTLEAAKMILKNDAHKKQFTSGVVLDNLPDGFYFAITSGTRRYDANEKKNVGEYPRLVLAYRADVVNKNKTPLTPQIKQPIGSRKIKGNVEQFNVRKDRVHFTEFTHHHINKSALYFNEGAKTRIFRAIATQTDLVENTPTKSTLTFDKSSKDPVRAQAILKRRGCYLTYLCHSDPFYIDTITRRRSPTSLYSGVCLDDIEENLKSNHDYLIRCNQWLRDDFLLLLRGEAQDCEDKEIAEKIIRQYETLFEFFENNDYAGLLDILDAYGCEGIEIFLKKLQKLFDCDEAGDAGTFFHFKNSVLLKSPNWTEFLEKDAQATLDNIVALTPRERLWWNCLVRSHINNAGATNLSDLWEGYRYFLQEFRKIGKEKLGQDTVVLLPEEYCLDTVNNMFVVLDRILMALSYSRDFNDSLKCLSSVNWNSPNTEYVLRQRVAEGTHSPYRLIAGAMNLHEHKTEEDQKAFEADKQDVNLILTEKELIDAVNKAKYIGAYIPKFLGPREFAAPFAAYLQAINDIGSGKYLNGSILEKNIIALLTTLTTTHERGHKCDILHELGRLFDRPYCLPFTLLLNEFQDLVMRATWLNLTELVNIARLSFALSSVSLFGIFQYSPATKANRDFIYDTIVEQKHEFTKNLSLYEHNLVHIKPKDYVDTLQFITDDWKGKDMISARANITRVFSIINHKSYNVEEAKKFADTLKQFKSRFGTYSFTQVLDIFSILQIEADKERPTIDDFIETANKLLSLEGPLDLHVIKSLPTNCFYDPADCRTVSMPPINNEDIISNLKNEILAEGIDLDEKKIMTEGFKYVVDTCHGHDSAPTARKYVEAFQRNQVRKHRAEMKFIAPADQKEEKESSAVKAYENQLEIITATIFYPDLSHLETGLTLIPMNEYADQVGIFVNLLTKIQTHWPQILSVILKKLCGPQGKNTVKRQLGYLNSFLKQIVDLHPVKSPFPMDLFTMLLDYEEKQKGGIDLELIAIQNILIAKKIPHEYKMKLLELNLSSAILKANSVKFIDFLIGFYDKLSSILPILLKIILSQGKTKTDLETIFSDTLKLIHLLDEIGGHNLIKKFFLVLDKNPTSYKAIIQHISAIPAESLALRVSESKEPALPRALEKTELKEEMKPLVTSDVKSSSEIKIELTDKKAIKEVATIRLELNKRQIITKLIFQVCEIKDFREENIIELIQFLTTLQLDTLKALLGMMPPPKVHTLLMIMEEEKEKIKRKGKEEGEIDNIAFLEDPTNPLYKYRDLKEQFDPSRLFSAVKELRILTPGFELEYEARHKILKQLLLINHYGNNEYFPIYLRDGRIPVTATQLTIAEIRWLIVKCREIFKTTIDASKQEQSILIFITLMREIMWRAVGKFPYTTQIIPLLIALLNSKNIEEEIDTGEGKAMITAMLVVLTWFMSDTQNAVTSNDELANDALLEFSPFFELLNVPHAQDIITSQSDVEKDYAYGGINYSFRRDFPIFLAKQKLNRTYLRSHDQTQHSYTLILDEADVFLLNDKVHYRVADLLHKIDLSWVYKVVYEFVRLEEFKNVNATIAQDIENLRKRLVAYAKGHGKNGDYIEKAVTDKQIDTWIRAAECAPIMLIPEKHYHITEEERGTGVYKEKISFARILGDDQRISEGGEWSNGLQQSLHTFLNQKLIIEEQKQIPPFPIDQETAPVASLSSKDAIEHHINSKGGRLIGLTGTAGSAEELEELYKKYGILAYRVPPHRPNKREIEPSVLTRDEEGQFAEIVNSLLRHIRQNESLGLLGWRSDPFPQPCYVHFNDIKTSERFYNYLLAQLGGYRFRGYEKILHTQLRNASVTRVDGIESKTSVTEIISNMGVAGWITVGTVFGRGTDSKPRLRREDKEQNHPNGLFVIEACLVPETESRQIQGRAARNGHPGQAQLIVNQKEFSAHQSVEKARRNLAKTAKKDRLFAERLSTIKNIFFQKFVDILNKDESALTPQLREAWSNCLNTMDVIWQQAVANHGGRGLPVQEILEKATDELVKSAVSTWNLSRQLKPLLSNTQILTMIKQSKLKEEKKVASDIEYMGLDLKMQDVSVVKEYIDRNPLLVTTEEKNLSHAWSFIEGQRSHSAQRCIAQLLKAKSIDMTSKNMKEALLRLFTERLADQPIPLKKILIECFAVIEWSKDKRLKESFTNLFYDTFCDFVRSKIAEFQIKLLAYRIDKKSFRTDQAKPLQELLAYVSAALAAKEKEENAKGFIESYVSSYIHGSTKYLENLKKLEIFIKANGFLDKNELTLVLADAPKSLVFANSWAVDFDLKACTDQLEEKTEAINKLEDKPECELSNESDYVFAS